MSAPVYPRGTLVLYKSGQGFLYSAAVLVAHLDGSVTIRLYFPIRDGVEMSGCFQGDRLRVDPARNIVGCLGPALDALKESA